MVHTFSLVEDIDFRSPNGKVGLQVYKPSSSGFRIININVPGPLCYASIIVPTIADNDKGLPHTLEHLIFCGSKEFPLRGYLDSLANRSLSTGTNAYTTEDHTAYTLATAGAEGMINTLPVFLDHVLHPTLRDEQFVTEVYHVDGQGKEQGVVYSEMASREHSEADLLDFHLRKELYRGMTTYSHECGGLTPDIATLTNEEIIEYHKRFYHPDNITLILAGDNIDMEKLFNKLNEHPDTLEKTNFGAGCKEKELVFEPPTFSLPDGEVILTKVVPFPSNDDDVGSIGYGWRGPPVEDVFNIVAIEVLFRYLHETSAAPLSQRFVERPEPYANQIDFEVKAYTYTSLLLVFSGVPYNQSQDDEDDEDMSDEESEGEDELRGKKRQHSDEESAHSDVDDETMEDDFADDPSENPVPPLFEPNAYYSELREVFSDIVNNGFLDFEQMRNAVKRHRIKILEALEEDPHEVIASYLLLDVLASHYSSTSVHSPKIGTRSKIFQILDELELKSEQFWQDLLKTWFLDQPVVEIKMIPDTELGPQLDAQKSAAQEARCEELGPDGLALQAEIVNKAVDANTIRIPSEVLRSMPAIPTLNTVSKLPSKLTNLDLSSNADFSMRPFKTIQLVETDTYFTHVKFCFPTQFLDENVRPYLVLFQELLSQTDVIVPVVDKESTLVKTEKMDYRDLVNEISRDLVSHECAVGFGNDTFACSWMSEVFVLAASSEPAKFSKLCELLTRILMFASFTRERILIVAKNLLSELVELKREGGDMMAALTTRITSALRPSESNTQWDFGKASNAATKDISNDIPISIFRQEAFLKSVIYKLEESESNEAEEIIDCLQSIQASLLMSIQQILAKASKEDPQLIAGFLQISTPFDFSPSGTTLSAADELLRVWDSNYAKYLAFHNPNRPEGQIANYSTDRCVDLKTFPFPRSPYKAQNSKPIGLVLPMSSITSSFLLSVVPCDILHAHIDLNNEALAKEYFATILLCEIFSRAEGPLYTLIRGNGYAYDASLCVYAWTGQMVFEIRDAADPIKAVQSFWELLKNMKEDASEWDKLVGDFELDTARAGIAYRSCMEGATAGGVIGAALGCCLKGFGSLETQEKYFRRYLYSVDKVDLRGAFEKYLTRFLEVSGNSITLALTPSDNTKLICEQLSEANPARIKFAKAAVDDFMIEDVFPSEAAR
ncbi:hypothetical protein K493DRAFT_18579 [Basidiobolus meristosporus CBS 931.73]|uniref:Uncharacterized protein n=1 Tax=Basidiobolus meristosporus CBS 931.73 TaxID=1314790 RepID=A0A1Y1Z924_9FUNG|nr:hypothetical protein K493DRAFT_18579 [Basidiobolus meristosporus CBS 931.73]|eukprot:ORY06614.1 hypothetical protein K493DRAFT_18579 [Basidiobolus meristosporus CBS 931.73]